MFQSAPPAEARGDNTAPRRPAIGQEFQSAPPAEARGDACRWTSGPGSTCFNPLPPPKRGEIGARGRRTPEASGFNPLPPPKRGEMAEKREYRQGIRVSIRSPRRSEGRCWTALQLVHTFEFQSAPPAEARGDANHYNRRNIKRLDARMRDPATLVAVRPLFDCQRTP